MLCLLLRGGSSLLAVLLLGAGHVCHRSISASPPPICHSSRRKTARRERGREDVTTSSPLFAMSGICSLKHRQLGLASAHRILVPPRLDSTSRHPARRLSSFSASASRGCTPPACPWRRRRSVRPIRRLTKPSQLQLQLQLHLISPASPHLAARGGPPLEARLSCTPPHRCFLFPSSTCSLAPSLPRSA